MGETKKQDNRRIRLLRIAARSLSVFIFFSLLGLCVIAAIHPQELVISTIGNMRLTFFFFPFLLMGGLYGYFLSMLAFFAIFISDVALNMEYAYVMAVFLVAILCFSLFSQFFYFSTTKKTIIAAFSTLALTSLIEYACLTIIMTNDFSLKNIKDYAVYFSRDTVVIVGTAFLLKLFFTKAPDYLKVIFPLGVGYTKAYKENTVVQRDLRKTRVSMKITAIIIAVELVLGVSVGIFMAVLFPDLKNIFARGMEQRAPIGSDVASEDMVAEINRMEYRLDAMAFGFDVKMVLLMLCVGVPLAAIANFYTKMTIGGPIGKMSDFMEDYADADDDKKLSVGHMVDRLEVKTGDEIGVLGQALKTTVHSIEDYIGRLKAEQELEKELEIAQKSSEAKSSFLSNMSHEIRTPINAVLGLNEMILRECRDEQILEYASGVESAGNSLLGIINDILDFSKIEAGKMDILPTPYHLGSLINDLINMVEIKAEDKGLELRLGIDPLLPSELVGDEIRIKQCVTNILTNAVKYTENGSVSLNISSEKLDESNINLTFQVVDTGIGIKEEDLDKLYSPFERIEEIRNRSIEGTGLGMSIVKKLLALMDTRLVVKSVYGEGSDFSFTVKQEVVSFEPLGDFRKKYKEFVQSRTKYHAKFRAPSAEILVVDDTPMNLTVVKGLLKNTLIQVDTAGSGFETLEKVRNKRYDIIFIDHRMPEMDGIETLDAMKKLDGNLCGGVPVVALTANAGERAREEYISAGFDDYLSKPVNGELLEDMIRGFLPEDKIEEAESTDTKENAESEGFELSDEDKKADGLSADTDDSDPLGSIEGIDIKEALKNCGSREILEEVLADFAYTIDTKADNIEKYALEKDYRNYTVAVHALKSSARLTGAMKLSEDAAYLEECGNNENEAEIASKTPQLLELYRSYNRKLSLFLDNGGKDDLPEIQRDELEGAYKDMKELLEAYDFDTADGIMKMLSEYRVPQDCQEKYELVKRLMADVDRDRLLEVL
ncbi:MAG: response regulator [Butyrivibrio sp.]|nr:response regulator [Butyrivibrio sp.]